MSVHLTTIMWLIGKRGHGCKLLRFALDPDGAALPRLAQSWLHLLLCFPHCLMPLLPATSLLMRQLSCVFPALVSTCLLSLSPCRFSWILVLMHGSLPKMLAAECDTLTKERINAAAAFECRFGFTDIVFNPFAVLLYATAMSVGMPEIFYVDVVLGLINSLFEWHLALDLRRFPSASRNRYWVAVVANVGEGKSPATAPIVALLEEVVAQYPHLVPGTATNCFHYQQDFTSVRS